jgi:hypothetical protein
VAFDDHCHVASQNRTYELERLERTFQRCPHSSNEQNLAKWWPKGEYTSADVVRAQAASGEIVALCPRSWNAMEDIRYNMHHLNYDRPDINLWTEWSSAQYRRIEQQPVWNMPCQKLDDNTYVQSWHPGISNILPAYEDSFMKMPLTEDDRELISDPSHADIEAFRFACGWDHEEIEWELKIRAGLQEEIRRMGAIEEEIFNLLIQTDACLEAQGNLEPLMEV